MPRKKNTRVLNSVLGGELLEGPRAVRQSRLLVYIVFLVILYISSHNAYENLQRKNKVLEREIKNLEAIYTDKAASLTDVSRRRKVEQMLKQKGSALHAPVNPPQWIEYNGK